MNTTPRALTAALPDERLPTGAAGLAVSPRAEKQREYLATTPASCRGIVARALCGEGSPRNAIKAKCLDCSGFDRSEVKDCRVVTCALWSFRPYQTDTQGADDEQQ